MRNRLADLMVLLGAVVLCGLLLVVVLGLAVETLDYPVEGW